MLKETDGRVEDKENAGIPEYERELAQPDNIEKHAFFFIKKDGGAEGKKLKENINKTRVALLELLDSADQQKVRTDLFTPDPKAIAGVQQSWESEMFEHAPLAAVMTMLAKIQNDCKNTELQVLDLLLSAITKDEKSFDKFVAIARPVGNSQIPIGKEFTAEIYLAAYDSKQNSEILVNGRPVEVKDGKGIFKTIARTEGENRNKVRINIQKSNGDVETQETEVAFTAFKGMATVSADKMNVVYIGLDNPISVSVPGTSPDQLVITCVGGIISGRNGKYILKVTGGRFADIVVSVRESNGTLRQVESKRYRIKPVPNPVPMIGRINNTSASVSQLRGLPYVVCDLQNFVFDSIRYRVVSFDAKLFMKTGNYVEERGARGQSLPPKILNALGQTRGGETLLISNIRAEALGTNIGVVKISTPIMLTIQ